MRRGRRGTTKKRGEGAFSFHKKYQSEKGETPRAYSQRGNRTAHAHGGKGRHRPRIPEKKKNISLKKEKGCFL